MINLKDWENCKSDLSNLREKKKFVIWFGKSKSLGKDSNEWAPKVQVMPRDGSIPCGAGDGG